jgi:hypothetical protein
MIFIIKAEYVLCEVQTEVLYTLGENKFFMCFFFLEFYLVYDAWAWVYEF